VKQFTKNTASNKPIKFKLLLKSPFQKSTAFRAEVLRWVLFHYEESSISSQPSFSAALLPQPSEPEPEKIQVILIPMLIMAG
jgi:hypothetical protein